MSAIAARVGGSKATLYGYFSSKEDLLRAVLDHDVSEEADRLDAGVPVGEGLRSGLIRLGIAYLTGHPRARAHIRTVSLTSRSRGTSTSDVLRPAWQRLADRFATMMKEGRLKFADPWITAMHWKGLTDGTCSKGTCSAPNSARTPMTS